jgi:hypothetical protein
VRFGSTARSMVHTPAADSGTIMSNPALRSSGANIAPVSTACSRFCLALIASAFAPGAALAQPAAPPPAPLAPLAHSALLTLQAAPVNGGLTLRIERATGQTPLVVNDLAVRIDGKSAPATLRPDGSWLVAPPAGTQDAGKTIEVTVGHDGIHEILSGRLASAGGKSASADSGAAAVVSNSHKQIFWWILNIAIVAIAAIAISRRMS